MIRYLLIILMASQLFACASTDVIKKTESLLLTSHNTEKILAIDDWRLLGRVSVRSSNRSWFATLEWKHDVLVDDLTLRTSLGGVVARLIYSGHGISILDEDGVLRRTSEEELQSLLGYSPPLDNMKYWVRGLPSPEIQLPRNIDYFDGIMKFKQDGWDVRLESFNKRGDIVLPDKISLAKKGLKIKLVVDEWLM